MVSSFTTIVGELAGRLAVSHINPFQTKTKVKGVPS
jgi:hypothetical protein